MKTALFKIFAVSLVTFSTQAETSDIIEFKNGSITWTNSDPSLFYSIEWCSSLISNNWTSSFRNLQDLKTNSPIIKTDIPMFFKIVGTTIPSHTMTLSPTTTIVQEGYYLSTNLISVAPDLLTSNIKSGATIFGIEGKTEVVDTSSGNANAAQILSGQKAWVDGEEITGTIINRGAVTITPGTSQKSISIGYHNGSGVVQGDSDLQSVNIKKGVTIFGVTGKNEVVDTSSGNAVASDITTGKKAWVDGVEITGTASASSSSVIETYINGTFNGWSGSTTVTTADGNSWQQSEYYYSYHYAFMPDAVVYNTGYGWKMWVEGIDRIIRVNKLN